MASSNTVIHRGKKWTADELRKAPASERDAVLMEAASLAEGDYQTDAGLTGFDAFGKEDLHGESANAEPG